MGFSLIYSYSADYLFVVMNFDSKEYMFENRFQTGGAIRPGSIYVERPADRELFEALSRGEFCYVLAPRQIGKSSLRVRVSEKLQGNGIHCATIDLQGIGTNLTPEQWYFGLLEDIAESLDLEVDYLKLWEEKKNLSLPQRFGRFLRKIVLRSIEGKVVIFVDEIDSVLSLKFSGDDFFALIRSVHEGRKQHPEYERLAFCLMGVAAPYQLINDPIRTPFNVGREVRLRDFTWEETITLAPGLMNAEHEVEKLLRAVYDWTEGHPYMTNKLCERLAQGNDQRYSEAEWVKALVVETFLQKSARDPNLQYARTRFERSKISQRAEILALYNRLLMGNSIPIEMDSLAQTELLLTGLAAQRETQGKEYLKPRNRIFSTVFDKAWVKENQSGRPFQELLERWLEARQRKEKSDDYLLRGKALEEAEAWAQQRKDLTIDERNFLNAAQEAKNRERERTEGQIEVTSPLVLEMNKIRVINQTRLVTETTINYESKVYKREKMVNWYDPSQLMKTANQILISTILGRHADRRLVHTLTPEKTQTYEYTKEFRTTAEGYTTGDSSDLVERGAIWVDYVSNLGDGWDSTYTVAFHLAQEALQIEGEILPRGKLLIMGGNEVYPEATSADYQNRLEHPYSTAMQNNISDPPHLFVLPGSNDWADSLSSFSRIFTTKSYFPLFDDDDPPYTNEKSKWYLPQHRSYFAIKLPHNYWLIGIDLQLSSDIDLQQIEYFKEVAEKQMQAGDQIILCSPEPYWIYSEMYGKVHPSYRETLLSRGYLEDRIFSRQKIVAHLAGDLHHYFRILENQTDVVRITAGGGGAFLHPTNGQMDKTYRDKRDCSQCSFPTAAESQRLCWRNFLFPLLNWRFGFLTAILYFLTSWSILAFLKVDADCDTYWDALVVTFHGVLETPVGTMWAVFILGGFLMFTDTHSRVYRIVAGLTHGIVHLIAIFMLGWGSYFLTVGQGMTYKEPLQFNVSGAFIFIGGWIVGSMIFGIYLFISLNVFGRHPNEAFSSLAIPDYKNFLRMKIDKDGLTIYPIGIRRVPRKWREATANDQTVSAYVPDDPKATPPILIEPPIYLKR